MTHRPKKKIHDNKPVVQLVISNRHIIQNPLHEESNCIVTFIFPQFTFFKRPAKDTAGWHFFTAADIITDDNIDSYFYQAGLTYDLSRTKHRTEGGVYRNYISNLNSAGGFHPVCFAYFTERYISIPFLYKFRSKIVNLSWWDLILILVPVETANESW